MDYALYQFPKVGGGQGGKVHEFGVQSLQKITLPIVEVAQGASG